MLGCGLGLVQGFELDEFSILCARPTPRVQGGVFPSVSASFYDSKVKVHIGDATDFVQLHRGSFDVIITDCCDPTTPG